MFEHQAQLIENRFKLIWGERTIIVWDNSNRTVKRGTEWVRLTMTWVESLLVSGTYDKGVYRDHGLITVEVYTPVNRGTRRNSELCEVVQSVYRNYMVDYLKCEASYVQRAVSEQEWFHQNIYIPFYYDNHLE